MANLPTLVRPGDLISASLVTEMIARILDHDQRLNVLEGGSTVPGQVAITQVLPGDIVQVKQIIQIKGRNFDFSVGAQRVFFDTSPVLQYETGSSDNLLVVEVPTIPSLPDLGKPVTLTVSNRTTSATWQLTVTPLPQNVSGPVDVVPQPVSPNPPVAGQNADFGFILTSRATANEAEFTLTPTLTGPAWQDRLRLLDQNKAPLSDGRIRLTRNVGQLVFVRINPVPPGTNGTVFDLMLTTGAVSGSAGGDSGVKSYTIGTAAPAEDPTISIGSLKSDPIPAYANGTLSVSPGAGAVMQANIGVQGSAATYNISLATIPTTQGGGAATNWSLTMLDPSPTNANDPTKSQIPITGGKTIEFFVEPKSNATTPGRLEIKVQRQSGTTFKTTTINLQKT
jgi:hypothetical protein